MTITRRQYSRKSLQLDHYETKNTKKYILHIISEAPAYILIAVHKGQLCYKENEKSVLSISLATNQCRMLFANSGKYCVELITKENSFHVICLAPELLYPMRDEFNELIRFMNNPALARFHSMESCTMDQIFKHRLARLIEIPPMRYKDFNRHLFWELPPLLSAYKGLLKNRDKISQTKKLLVQIQEFIATQIAKGDPVTAQNIIGTFPISRRTLARIFPQYLGQHPKQYIRSETIKKAGNLLAETNISLFEIAVECGYSDINSLNRAFKKIKGHTLASYRKIYQK
ncbi:helix-turn-helix domain-containing protein [Sphingobacterium hungaricum]|nr:helix-turn-helix transcriptional regulator [Sphingobacterium hungaricum]